MFFEKEPLRSPAEKQKQQQQHRQQQQQQQQQQQPAGSRSLTRPVYKSSFANQVVAASRLQVNAQEEREFVAASRIQANERSMDREHYELSSSAAADVWMIDPYTGTSFDDTRAALQDHKERRRRYAEAHQTAANKNKIANEMGREKSQEKSSLVNNWVDFSPTAVWSAADDQHQNAVLSVAGTGIGIHDNRSKGIHDTIILNDAVKQQQRYAAPSQYYSLQNANSTNKDVVEIKERPEERKSPLENTPIDSFLSRPEQPPKLQISIPPQPPPAKPALASTKTAKPAGRNLRRVSFVGNVSSDKESITNEISRNHASNSNKKDALSASGHLSSGDYDFSPNNRSDISPSPQWSDLLPPLRAMGSSHSRPEEIPASGGSSPSIDTMEDDGHRDKTEEIDDSLKTESAHGGEHFRNSIRAAIQDERNSPAVSRKTINRLTNRRIPPILMGSLHSLPEDAAVTPGSASSKDTLDDGEDIDDSFHQAGMDDSFQPSVGYQSAYRRESLQSAIHDRRESLQSAIPDATINSPTTPNKRSLGRTTKKFAKTVASQPVKLAKNVAKQPRKFAKGATKRLRGGKRRGSKTGNNDETVDLEHFSSEEYAFVEETLRKNFTDSELEGVLHALVLAFDKFAVLKGHVLIQQGDNDSEQYVYIVEQGECSVAVDGINVPGPYGTFKAKSIFGDLGVLTSTSRAETITAKTDNVTLFRAFGADFVTAFSKQPRGGDGEDLSDNDDNTAVDEQDRRDIDKAIDQLSGTKSLYGGEITKQYQPSRVWLWSQWHGTILEQNLLSTIYAMLMCFIMVILIRSFAEPTWTIGHAPDPEHPLIEHLAMINGVWIYMMTLTTFILTFYVNQAYTFWQSTNSQVRQIQGRISDFMISVATHAKRNDKGTFTPESEAIMDDIGASARLFHALFWAGCARRFYCLSSSTGMARMAHRGMMTPKQLKILQSLDTPNTTKHYACLEWMMIRASQGLEDGQFRNVDALSRQLLEVTCELRSTSVKVLDSLKSRMPLSYTHLVQILVDSFIWMSPLALYAELGDVYSIFCVGVIALFYGGLLDMAKIFLDPLDNQNFSKTSINMGMDLGVLTRESNAATCHFKDNAAKLPF